MTAIKTNVTVFQSDLKKAAEQLGVDVATAVRRAGLKVFTGVVERTPVDTGRARASWNITYDTADLQTKPEGHYPSPPPASLPESKDIRTIVVANGLPYIEPLNSGHSKQAPAGFVELAVAEAEAELNGLF